MGQRAASEALELLERQALATALRVDARVGEHLRKRFEHRLACASPAPEEGLFFMEESMAVIRETACS